MNNVKEFGQRVVKMRMELGAASPEELREPVIFITSLDNPDKGSTPGSVVDAFVDHAARRIVSGTHRKSTPEEIERFRAEQAARDRECRVIEERQKEKSVLALTPELAQQLGMVQVRNETAKSNKKEPVSA